MGPRRPHVEVTDSNRFSTAGMPGADESLEIGSPVIPSDKLQEVQLPLARPALAGTLYGFRGRTLS